MSTWVLAAMLLLSPGRDHARLAGAIARAAESSPLFRGDDGARNTAALLVAVAFRESSFRTDAVGDKGRSFCAMQVHVSSGGSPALLEDADACVRRGLEILRASILACPEHPVAWYAAGPGACRDARAQRISRDRMALARRLVTEVGK